MATVVNKAHPAATTSPDTSIKFAQSLADPEIPPLYGSTVPTIVGSFQTTDDRGNPNTGTDFTKAGSDLSRT